MSKPADRDAFWMGIFFSGYALFVCVVLYSVWTAFS